MYGVSMIRSVHMEQQTQVEELSLLEIFKILFKKIKLLLIVLLASIVAGGVFGALITLNQDYYGTEIWFYINPKEKLSDEEDSTYGVYGSYGDNVMDTMTKLLESDLFTEQLVEGWNRTPVKLLDDGSLNPKYKAFIYALKETIEFSYDTTQEKATGSSSTLAKSFIIVNIELLADDEELVTFAEELLVRLRNYVPEYVTRHMIVPSGFEGTNCKEITTISEIEHLNENNTVVSAVKYAVIIGVLGTFIACVAVLIDNRVKTHSALKQLAKEETEE